MAANRAVLQTTIVALVETRGRDTELFDAILSDVQIDLAPAYLFAAIDLADHLVDRLAFERGVDRDEILAGLRHALDSARGETS